MKKILFLAAVAAMVSLTSCQKDDFNAAIYEQAYDGLVFTASLDNGTRTTITDEGTAGYKISWEATDTISINGVKFVPSIDKFNPALAIFTKASNETKADPTAPYTAYYPASIYEDSIATLPAKQIYKADGNIAGILPMYAESSDLELDFKNLCGLMKFTLKGTEKLQTITLTDDTKALSGKFTVSGNAAVLDSTAKGGVTLDCGEAGVQLDETTGKTFYVAVPAGSYEKLRIEYNTVNYAKYAKMKANATATVERNKVYPFTQTPTFRPDWFYFEAVEAGAEVGMTADDKAPSVSLQYSTDGGENWNDFTVGSTSVALAEVGDRVYFKAKNNNTVFNSGSYNNHFTTSKKANIGGNIMYLLNGETPGLSLQNSAFHSLFRLADKIISASNLRISATTMGNSCCASMFENCTALVDCPSISATTTGKSSFSAMFNGCTALVNARSISVTTMGEQCCSEMFRNCSKLVNVRSISATTMGEKCCFQMFNDCTALVDAPGVLATTIGKDCCEEMFQGCTSLVNAPALPATTLEENCYMSMFQGCIALVNAPALPATTIAKQCYYNMFNGCTSLVNAPATLPATTLADKCYYNMFRGCTDLVIVPTLPATTLKASCYQGMFYNCSKLSSVTMLATDVSATNCLANWLKNAGTTEGSHILYVDPTMTNNATIMSKAYGFTIQAYSGE